jgi:hypothetical protein
MNMKITIEKVLNGYIIKQLVEDLDDDSMSALKEAITVVEDQPSDADTMKTLLDNVIDLFGESGSRHDAKRVYAVVLPGDKHPDFNDLHLDIIFK